MKTKQPEGPLVVGHAGRGAENLTVQDGERRGASRSEATHNAAFKLGNMRYAVEVADVSKTGAQICIRVGLMPNVGQAVTLDFMNKVSVDANVVWVNGNKAGLTFVEPLGDPRDVLHFDDLGAEYYGAVLRLQLARD